MTALQVWSVASLSVKDHAYRHHPWRIVFEHDRVARHAAGCLVEDETDFLYLFCDGKWRRVNK
jgi:hypothetical protein